MSTDDVETLKKFRESLKSKDTFVSDKEATLTKLYDVKAPLITLAMRHTFVIGPGRKIQAVISGSDAMDPENSVRACKLPSRTDGPVSRPGAGSSTDAGVSK